MNPVSLDFVEAAASGGPAATTASAAEHGAATSDGFGDLLQEVLAQQAAGATTDVPTEGRGRAGLGDDADAADGADAGKETDSDQSSTTDVVNLFTTVDLLRTMPVPPPPPTETGDAIGNTKDTKNTKTTSSDREGQEVARELSDVAADVDAPANADLEHGAPKPQTTNNAPATIPMAARDPHTQPTVDPRAQNTDRAPSTPVAITKASNRTTSQPQAAPAEATASNPTPPADTPVAEPQWRQVMLARLAELIESSSDPSTKPASRSSVPAPAAAEIARALSLMAEEASTEHRSIVSTSPNASGAGQMSEIDRLGSLDRHMQTPVLQYRLDPSMMTPLRLAYDTAPMATATPVVVIDEPTMDEHLPEQIVQSIRIQALDLGGEARVRLRPEYLGEVVVSVKVDRGAVTATLQADTPAVRRWIETHETSLRVGLADQGLHLDRLIISEPAKTESESGERRRQPSQEQPERQQPRRSNQGEDTPTFEVVA